MQPLLPSRDLVLIGAGHTNLHLVRMWRMQPIDDVALTVVSPFSRATYSGMLPGTLAGLYQPDDMEIDLHRFCTSCGARLIVAKAVGFDLDRRQVLLEGRPPIPFDVASIGIGSVPGAGDVWRNHPEVLSIKPMQTFLKRIDERLDLWCSRLGCSSQAGRPHHKVAETPPKVPVQYIVPNEPESRRGLRPISEPRIAVVGGGAAGVEVTLCLDAYLRRRGLGASLTLIDSHESVLPGYAPKTVRLAGKELDRRGVARFNGRRAEDFADGHVLLSGGERLPADLVIWATRAAPPPELEQFDLPRAADGFLAVRPTLQTTADAPVFVVGDTATLVDNPVPKAGVYAVREGPVVWENIQRLLAGRELEPYNPQRGFLSMLSTGDGRAIMQYKGFSFHGGWVWKWKDHIDRKFMRMYQDYRPMSADDGDLNAKRGLNRKRGWPGLESLRSPGGRSTGASLRSSPGHPPAMRCRGCGGKVGANVLTAALQRLDIPASDFVRQGLNPPDDAAVLDPQAAAAEVLSVDFFHAFMDDRYIVGRVAALNALSDLWATGARPLGALALVVLPDGPQHAQTELLYQLLAGGLRELSAAGATLLGGHTVAGDELMIGYSVVGTLDGATPFTKAGLHPGDRLILTRPLGTGVLLAAHAQAACRATWMDALLANMLQPNAAAARVAREFDVTSVTDVTGFGLAGHLFEMLDAGGVSAELSLAALPLLDGFAELSGDGTRSSLDPANREIESRIACGFAELTTHPAYDALFDPQTSGGLLIGVSPARAEELCARLRDGGDPRASIIGTVTEPSDSPELRVVD